MKEGYTPENKPTIQRKIQESIRWLEKLQSYLKNNSDIPIMVEFQIREHIDHAELKMDHAINYMDNPTPDNNE